MSENKPTKAGERTRDVLFQIQYRWPSDAEWMNATTTSTTGQNAFHSLIYRVRKGERDPILDQGSAQWRLLPVWWPGEAPATWDDYFGVQAEERIEKGSMVRLIASLKDARWVRVAGVHPSGTAVTLAEARAGYYHWNIGDVELESRVERHTRLAKEAIGF